jgi:CHAD domain-containing protein
MGEGQGAVRSATEIERKLDVDPSWVFPDLSGPDSGLPPGIHGDPGDVIDLEATYFDSDDLRLLGEAITLRRRTGGEDEGWHLKLPRHDGERQELRLPPGRSATTVPLELRRRTAVHLRGAPLRPVARLSTRRRLHLIRDARGRPLAEVADDTVTATREGNPARSWREIEVELLDGDRDILSAVVETLTAAGARPSDSRSKVGRALGEPATRSAPAPAAPRRPGSVGDVLMDYLDRHVDVLIHQDPAVRTDQDDAVHQMRVACRRLRSVLAVYRDVFEAGQVDALCGELRWLGTVLGRARDTEVVRDRLLAAVAAEPRQLVRGPVRRRIGTEFRNRLRADRTVVLSALDSGRYFALLDALDAFRSDPHLAPIGRRRAVRVLPGILRAEHRRLRRAGRAAVLADPAGRDNARHRMRKAARRLRFAAEAAAGGLGRPAERLAARMKAVQDVLGAYQDGVVARAALEELEPTVHGAGETTFTYGRMHAELAARAGTLDAELADPWRRAIDRTILRRLD